MDSHEKPPASSREAILRAELMQALGRTINEVLPQNWGFFLMTFPVGNEPGGMNYVASAKREDVRLVMLEFLYRDLGGKPGILTNVEKPKP